MQQHSGTPLSHDGSLLTNITWFAFITLLLISSATLVNFSPDPSAAADWGQTVLEHLKVHIVLMPFLSFPEGALLAHCPSHAPPVSAIAGTPATRAERVRPIDMLLQQVQCRVQPQ